MKNEEAFRLCQVVPAERGWNVIGPDHYEDDKEHPVHLHKEPVIAWCVEVYKEPEEFEPRTRTTPVTADILPTHWVLERPDGGMFDLSNCEFNSEKEVEDHFLELLSRK